MARILPRLLAKLERQGKPPVFPSRPPRRRKQSLYRPPLPRPSFHPAAHPQSILLSPGSPVVCARDYARHKSRPPSLAAPAASASTLPDAPRQMTPAEFGWWSNPYLRMLSSPMRLCMVTQRHLPADFLIRLVGMQVPPSRLRPEKKAVAKLVPDGILHPKYTNRKVSGGSYVLCWREAVKRLEKGGYKRISPDLSLYPNLVHHIAHLLRLRVLQEFELLAERLEYAVGKHKIFGIPNPTLRRLTREEWGLMRTTGSLPYQDAVAVLIVPPINKDVATKQRPTGSMSPLPPQDEHLPATLPPSSALLDSSEKPPDRDLPDAVSFLRIPLYNSVSAFPSRSQRAGLHSLLLRILRAERFVKRLHSKKVNSKSFKETTAPSKGSHAFILCSNKGTIKRGDPAAVALALWRLRMYDSEGWSDSIP